MSSIVKASQLPECTADALSRHIKCPIKILERPLTIDGVT
jgi:hypothetical protein